MAEPVLRRMSKVHIHCPAVPSVHSGQHHGVPGSDARVKIRPMEICMVAFVGQIAKISPAMDGQIGVSVFVLDHLICEPCTTVRLVLRILVRFLDVMTTFRYVCAADVASIRVRWRHGYHAILNDSQVESNIFAWMGDPGVAGPPA